MKTWQYEITALMEQDALNAKGSEGWEVTAAYTEAPGLLPRLVWKRETQPSVADADD